MYRFLFASSFIQFFSRIIQNNYFRRNSFIFMNVYQRYCRFVELGLAGDVGALLTLAEVTQNHQDHGQITLAAGEHQVSIATRRPANQVYLWLEYEDYQVCQAQVNLAGVIVNATGFTIVANIKSNSCIVHWLLLN